MTSWTRERFTANYCPKLGHCVSSLGVCERRSLPVMAPAWPTCTECSYETTLEDPGDRVGLTTYSDPPPQWKNMDRYKGLK